MLYGLLMLLLGYCEVTLAEGLKASNRYLKGKLSLSSLERRGKAAVGLIFRYQKRRVQKELAREGLTGEISPVKGLPAFFYRHRFRVGAIVGIVFGITLSFLSGEYIWQIDVVGNERLQDEEILSYLREEGVYEGAYAKGIDALAVANRVLQKSDSLAFIGVNIVGNCVEAVVLEEEGKKEALPIDHPSNTVAKKNGVIVAVELESGVSNKKAGDTVSKGELLISGVNLLRNGSYLYERAKGRVFAETLNEITLNYPRYRYEKRYTGEIFEEKGIIFFNKSKKVTKEYGNLPLSCDRIETRERVMLFGKIPLPLWFVTVSYREFALDEITLTEKEAIRLCREKIMAELSGSPLVSYREDVYIQEDHVTLTVTYRCIEDIADEQPLFDLP